MASDETMSFEFQSSMQDKHLDNHHPHPHNLSRPSVRTSKIIYGVNDDDENDYTDEAMAKYMSVLSIEGDDADAEFSEDHKELLSSDSENHLSSCWNGVKEYGSEKKGVFMEQRTKEKDGRRRMRKDKSMRRRRKRKKSNKKKDIEEGVSVIKVLELEEVKACEDISFHFELELLSPLSLSLFNSTLDSSTSTAPTSPLPMCPISNPGDDPRDVKARIKMWAQAVAASASKYATSLGC